MNLFKAKQSVFSLGQFNEMLFILNLLNGVQLVEIQVEKEISEYNKKTLEKLVTLYSYSQDKNLLHIKFFGDVNLMLEDIYSIKPLICIVS